jgi:UDPglucose 6-dehydrogenase
VTEESQGVFIAKQLSKNGIRVVAFDPMSADMQIEELRRGIVVLNSIEECLSQAEAVLITTPDPAFKSLTAKDFRNEWSQVLVVDFWRMLRSELEGKEHIKYLGIGLSEDDATNNARLRSIWCEDHSSSKSTSAE